MKVLAQASAIVGAVLVLLAIVGRFFREPTITILPGQAHAASSLVQVAMAIFLFGILVRLLAERR
ncbi:MAG TPA: hypothetical protein EYP62_06835 [Kiritimatiellae bacterium]|nr:hypothetical protein [Kiritimatiellia bacterium]